MSKKIEITTKAGLNRAIKKAKEVLVSIRFGTLEHDARITKAEAKLIVENLADDETPESMELYGGIFAAYDPDTRTLWIG